MEGTISIRLPLEAHKLMKKIGAETGENFQDLALRLVRSEWGKIRGDFYEHQVHELRLDAERDNG